MKNLIGIVAATAVALGVMTVVTIMSGSNVGAADKSKVEITLKDGYRYIESNGIPNHKTGRFPNRGNPNRISAQNYKFKVPAKPKITPATRERIATGRPRGPMPLFGVALNGIPFDPGTAEAWNNDRRSGWNNEALTGKINLGIDMNNAHVQPTGAYHYHGIPNGLVSKLAGKDVGSRMVMIGYAADGFPVYSEHGYRSPGDSGSGVRKLASSYRLKPGTRPSGPKGKFDGTYLQDFEYVSGLGDLDECNGRTGVTPEYPSGTYYYVLTDEFPYVPRCHKGSPDSSFRKKGPPPGGGHRRRGGRRPPPRNF